MASIKPGRWKKKRWLELKHKSLFAYFKKKPQTEGTIVTRKLVSCILDDDFAKVTETDDKKKHGIESDSGKLIYSWNEVSKRYRSHNAPLMPNNELYLVCTFFIYQYAYPEPLSQF